MPYNGIWILIPAYKPDERLIELIDGLTREGFLRVAVVDDGGGSEFKALFDKARERGAFVLTHSVNRGKGAAIKTGLKYISENSPDSNVLTADCDGQHTIQDIKALADKSIENPGCMILGVRDKKQMPLRSLTGNTLTCFFFGITTGLWITDTQTGLRVMPSATLRRFIKIDGDRYEYEMNVLIVASREKIPVVEVPIRTVYIDKNSSSHFNVLKDSARIYGLLFRQFGAYAGSSLVAMGVDYGLAMVLRIVFPQSVSIPTYTARAVSSLANYLTNSRFVFKKDADNRFAAVKYYTLVIVVAILQVQLIRLFKYVLGMSYLPGKILADGILFIANFYIQRALVFKKIRHVTHAHKAVGQSAPPSEHTSDNG